MSHENEPTKTSTEDTKQYFINDEKFQRLKACQQSIFEATEVSPTLRKIVNELITGDNLERVKMKFIAAMNQDR